MFGSAYQSYYQDSRNTFVSSGQPGVVLWSKVQDKERWLSAKRILQLQEKETRSKLKKTALESGRATKEEAGCLTHARWGSASQCCARQRI
jgi:hypothetical protein